MRRSKQCSDVFFLASHLMSEKTNAQTPQKSLWGAVVQPCRHPTHGGLGARPLPEGEDGWEARPPHSFNGSLFSPWWLELGWVIIIIKS